MKTCYMKKTILGYIKINYETYDHFFLYKYTENIFAHLLTLNIKYMNMFACIFITFDTLNM